VSFDRNGLHLIDEAECLRLVESHPVHLGRVALVEDGKPVVLPINYRMQEGTVVFRTSSRALLDAAARGAVVAFEVDAVDPAWQDGWSVVLRGPVALIAEGPDLERVRRLPIRPWPPLEDPHYVRLRPLDVSGRRIV
jgi:uncharacterized protein